VIAVNFEEFAIRMKEIKRMGFVKTHREGPTGIGKTLEDLLGIVENNIAGPDFSIYELKSARKDSVSMLTLFTKTPQPEGANKELLRAFGYRQRKKPSGYKQLTLGGNIIDESNIPLKDKQLHVTIDAIKENSVGLILRIIGSRIYIKNDKNVEAYYEEKVLEEAFEKKYSKLVYVSASRKKDDDTEFLWFDEAYLLEGFSFKKFSELVKKGIIKLDLRIGHYPDGRQHDHGTGFRVFPRYLPQCFEKVEKIL
jgi:hypothetical protein